MRVLLARRFRENSNAAQSLEEEGEEPLGEIEEERLAIDEESTQGQLELQLQGAQTRLLNNHKNRKQPPRGSKDSAEKRNSQQLLSTSLPPKQTPVPQRKRRLSRSTQEENDYKLRSHQASAAFVEDDPSWLDSKPRARETGAVTNSKKRKANASTNFTKGSSPIEKDTIPKDDSIIPSISISTSRKSVPLSTAKSNPNKPKDHKMVSGGPGGSQHRRHGNSREEEEEEHLLNWQYGNDNLMNHAIIRPTRAEFDGPLENDPASARGDVSSSSPERQNHNSCYAIDLGENSSSYAQAAFHERGRIVPAPRIVPAFNTNGRDMSVMTNSAGSEGGISSLKRSGARSLNSSNNSKKKASTTAEEVQFRELLKKERGLEIREQDGDGNCLFRAISLQVYGDPSMHGDVRKQCMDHMERDQEHFSQFVTGEPFLQYVARTRQDGVHGNNPEIQASSELFNRPIEVFTPENGSNPLNIFHAEYKTGDVPIRLSYHDGNHYNAVIDPLMPTAGLGLGLPGLKPGYADKMQMAKAVAESIDAAADQDETELQQVLQASQVEYNNASIDNDDDLQRAIKESQLSAEHMSSNNALSLSDMDATYFELEQAALERSLQSYSQKEEGKKQRASTTTSISSSGDISVPNTMRGDHKAPAVQAPAASFATEALPCPSQESIPLAAAAPSSSGVESSSPPTPPQRLLPVEEYPSSVQELVMNGFPLSTVVKAFELVGNNFDHMLSLCLANTNSGS